jgi:glucose/arabinose dehydrogenase
MKSFNPLTVIAALGFAGLALQARPALAQLEPDAAMKFDISDYAQGLTQPTDIAWLRDGRAVITQKGGNIAVRRPDGTLIVAAGRPPGMVDSASEKGLLGVVADPDAPNVFYFYASLGNDTLNKHKVLKATLNQNNTFTFDPKLLISDGLQGPANHDGGGLVIFQKQLYISVGDTGANASPPNNKYGSCLNRANGKILRLNLDGTVPNDNPLSDLTTVTGCATENRASGDFGMFPPDKRIFAWGFRNPFRFWIDPMTGRLWIGDVGESIRESVHVGGKGQHFGWPFQEGTRRHPPRPAWSVGDCDEMVPSTPCTPPVFDYANSGARGDNCIIGGLIPDGCGWPEDFKTRYFFGDNGSGTVWTLEVRPDRLGVMANSRKVFGRVPGLVTFRMGPDSSLYAVSVSQRRVARITPKNQPAACVNTSPADGGSAPPVTRDAGAASMDAAAPTGAGGGAGAAGSGTGGTPGSTPGGPAGAGTGGTAGSSPGGAAGTPGQAGSPGTADARIGSPGPEVTMPDEGGCGCSLTGKPRAATGLLGGVFFALWALRRRSRSRSQSVGRAL